MQFSQFDATSGAPLGVQREQSDLTGRRGANTLGYEGPAPKFQAIIPGEPAPGAPPGAPLPVNPFGATYPAPGTLRRVQLPDGRIMLTTPYALNASGVPIGGGEHLGFVDPRNPARMAGPMHNLSHANAPTLDNPFRPYYDFLDSLAEAQAARYARTGLDIPVMAQGFGNTLNHNLGVNQNSANLAIQGLAGGPLSATMLQGMAALQQAQGLNAQYSPENMYRTGMGNILAQTLTNGGNLEEVRRNYNAMFGRDANGNLVGAPVPRSNPNAPDLQSRLGRASNDIQRSAMYVPVGTGTARASKGRVHQCDAPGNQQLPRTIPRHQREQLQRDRRAAGEPGIKSLAGLGRRVAHLEQQRAGPSA